MHTLLEQLSDDESILLMYLADELPAGDREQVERRLSAEADLRDRLAGLGETQDAVMAGLGRLDAATESPPDESAAVRRAASAIRQWQARAASPAAAQAPKTPNRWRVWAVPAAAAAMVLLVLGVAFHGLPKKGGAMAMNTHRPGPLPGALPALPGPGGLSEAPSAASAEDDEYHVLVAVTPGLPESDSVDEMIGSIERDVREPREDAGNREEAGEGRPVFDIPLDPGQ